MINSIARMVSSNGPQDLDQRSFEVSSLEQEITDAVKSAPFSTGRTAPVIPPQLPSYVQHAEGVGDIGRLTAQAVVSQWEETAKTIETMGKELIEVAQQTEEMAKGVTEAIRHCDETAAHYRAKAKEYFEQIQRASLLAAEVTKTCADLTTKIGVA